MNAEEFQKTLSNEDFLKMSELEFAEAYAKQYLEDKVNYEIEKYNNISSEIYINEIDCLKELLKQ